jgi:predicted nucleotidyltransferase component of viral defense system
MKKISATQLNIIDAIVAEYDIGGLNASILEKDIHVTDALSAITQIQDPNVNLVFCGGTSLSKAFGVIERMSEDIDLKIDIAPLSEMATSARKTYLSQYKEKIRTALIQAGFLENLEMAEASNLNQLFSMEWSYHSEYEGTLSLRPHLKIEVKTCQITCPTEDKAVGYLINRLIKADDKELIAHCQAIEETLAEKVISFLRRLDRVNSLGEDWDGALVRHIYDVYCITSADPTIVEKSKICFPDIMQNDAETYRSQQEDFGVNPTAILLKTLAEAEKNTSLAKDYEDKLLPLIFGDVKPSFEDAFANFKVVASTLLSN